MKQTMLKLLLGFSGAFILLNSFAQSVSTQKTIYKPAEEIIVNYSGFPGNEKDWLTIAVANAPDDKGGDWYYTNKATSGTMKFNGLPHGEYEVRGYFNNDYVVRARYRFKVGNADIIQIATDKKNYKKGEKITVTYSGMPGNARDWISIAAKSAPEDQSHQWFFTAGQQSGTLEFYAPDEGSYEARAYYNNEYTVRYRYPFTVGGAGQKLCASELSAFFAGTTGLGTAWGRAATEATIMGAGAIADIQGVLGNARDALNVVTCIKFDINKLTNLISRIPGLTNVEAVAEIEAIIKELQGIIAVTQLDCGNSATLMSLYVTAVHIGAAQAWASSRICMPAPMPAAIQTVISNHLTTAQNAFSSFLPCAPNVSLTSFTNIPLNSAVSAEPHTHIVGLHTNLLWNIALTSCCCDCK